MVEGVPAHWDWMDFPKVPFHPNCAMIYKYLKVTATVLRLLLGDSHVTAFSGLEGCIFHLRRLLLFAVLCPPCKHVLFTFACPVRLGGWLWWLKF